MKFGENPIGHKRAEIVRSETSNLIVLKFHRPDWRERLRRLGAAMREKKRREHGVAVAASPENPIW